MKNITQKLVLFLTAVAGPVAAFAQALSEEKTKQVAEATADATVKAVTLAHGSAGWVGLAAGLAIGLAAFGAAYGQSKTASAALEGIARNPSAQNLIFTPMLIALILIETMAIYAFVISFFLIGKI